jgi:hypothetical protein
MSDVLESEPVTIVLHSAVQGFAERKTWTYAATLMRSPDFADALEAYCCAMVQPPEVAWPTDKVFAQKLRYLVAFVLIGNDARWRRSRGEAPTRAALRRHSSSPRSRTGASRPLSSTAPMTSHARISVPA